MRRAVKNALKDVQREISALQEELAGKVRPHGQVVTNARGHAIRTKWPSNFNRADRALQAKFNRLKDATRLISEFAIGRTVKCWECGGSGTDPGSLAVPEPCAVCWGEGTLAPELVDELKTIEHLRRIA